jgi:hypothetical protein
MGVEDEEPGVAVRRRLGDRIGPDAAAGTGPVLDDDGGAEATLQQRLGEPRQGIDRAAAGVSAWTISLLVSTCATPTVLPSARMMRSASSCDFTVPASCTLLPLESICSLLVSKPWLATSCVSAGAGAACASLAPISFLPTFLTKSKKPMLISSLTAGPLVTACIRLAAGRAADQPAFRDGSSPRRDAAGPCGAA